MQLFEDEEMQIVKRDGLFLLTKQKLEKQLLTQWCLS